MYNNVQSTQQAQLIAQFAPNHSAVHGASSSFAKALYLLQHYPKTEIFCHQSDWLASSLTGKYGISDENNCLKLGFDSIKKCWPNWLQTPVRIDGKNIHLKKTHLPQVVSPGRVIAKVKSPLIKKYQLAENCCVVAGTTDSNAAVLASGAQQLGDAVTSLGSTLVVKIFSDKPIFNAAFGIYSHRLNNHWLVGGASNTGGSVLLQHFNHNEIQQMTRHLNENKTTFLKPTGLNYYPLPAVGERFPINDATKKSFIQPKAENPLIFFQGLLEGMANIETQAYTKLQQLGAPLLKNLYSCGGGAQNMAWTKIRLQNLLQYNPTIKLKPAHNVQASYGSALLAKQGFTQRN
jgi:sugar (pentulose or hexulose) kinase